MKITRRVKSIVLIITVFFFAFSSFFNLDTYAASTRVFDFTWTPQALTSIIGHNFNTIAKDMGTVVLAQSGQVERDKYYEVTLRTELTLDSTQQAINYRIPYVALGDYIVHLGNNVNDSSRYQEYSLKTICLTGAQMLDGLPSSTRMYVFHKDGLNLYGVANVTIDLVSYEEITSSDSGSFDEGYDQGFEDGQDQGYDDGYSDGYLDGEDDGYNQGFEDGKDSVDIDSIYMDGYNAGSEAAYVKGYDEGYSQGFTEALALNGSNSTSMKAGAKKTYSISKQILSTDLTHHDFDRFYPIFHNVNGFVDEIYHLEGFLDDTTFDIYGDSYLWANANYTGYTRFDSFKVFSTTPDVYAYSVRLKHNVGSYALRDGIEDVFLLFGTENDILNGNSFRTRSLSSEQFESVFWYLNDGSINDLYLAPLVQFNLDCDSGVFSDAAISVWFSANFEVTPYTKEEYSAAASAIEKQTLEIKNQMNDLKYGYDSSAGNAMNDKFESSLNEYQVAEDSIFTTASSALNDFTFFDFNSVPAMLTGISFVTAIMTSIFHAMGGASGAGIVLSVLFSVMLVSMILGLYRLYQSDGKKRGGSKGSKGGNKGGG